MTVPDYGSTTANFLEELGVAVSEVVADHGPINEEALIVHILEHNPELVDLDLI